MIRSIHQIGFALAAFAMPCIGLAGFTVVNFEDEVVRSDSSLSNLSISQDDLTIDIVRSSGMFGIGDFSSASGTTPFGARSLVPADGGGAFVFNFSKSLSSFSLQAGDFGEDTDTFLIEAFSGADGSGQRVATATGDLPPVNAEFTFLTLEVAGSPFRSIRAGGGAGGNSLIYDNFSAQAIPLPPALLGALPALSLAAYVSRRMKRSR